jgi:hypothetical protein
LGKAKLEGLEIQNYHQTGTEKKSPKIPPLNLKE